MKCTCDSDDLRISSDYLEATTTYCSLCLKLFEEFIDVYSRCMSTEREKVIYLLIRSFYSSSNTLLLLYKNRMTSDSFVISRSIVEKAVNIFYLLQADINEVNDYIDYGYQKGYRNYTRLKEFYTSAGGYLTDIKVDDELKRRIDKFTSEKGREITRWTATSFDSKVNLLSSIHKGYFDEPISKFIKLVYEDGSESSHGSLYGAVSHTRALSNSWSQEQAKTQINRYYQTMMHTICTFLKGIIETVNTDNAHDFDHYSKKYEDAQKVLLSYYSDHASN